MTKLQDSPPLRSDAKASPTRRAALEVRRRLRLAAAELPATHDESAVAGSGRQNQGAAMLGRWLESLPLPEPDVAVDAVTLSVTVASDLQRLAVRAAGPTPILGPHAVRFLEQAGADDDERARLSAAVDQLAPDRMGTWLEIGPEGTDGGWLVRGPLPLAAVRAFLPDGEGSDLLMDWAARHEIDTCLTLQRSVNQGTPYLDLSLPLPRSLTGLPGDDARHQLTAALLAFEVLGAPVPPEAVRRAVLQHGAGGMRLTAWLAEAGPARVGVRIPNPDEALLTALTQAAGPHDETALAVFTAAAGLGPPSWVETFRHATGLGAELQYALEPHADPLN